MFWISEMEMFYIMEQENLPWPLHNVLLKRNSRVGTGTQHHVVTFQLDKSFYPTCHVCTNWQGDMSLTSTKQISCYKIKRNKYIKRFFLNSLLELWITEIYLFTDFVQTMLSAIIKVFLVKCPQSTISKKMVLCVAYWLAWPCIPPLIYYICMRI